jgi:hypothetical protein
MQTCSTRGASTPATPQSLVRSAGGALVHRARGDGPVIACVWVCVCVDGCVDVCVGGCAVWVCVRVGVGVRGGGG